VIGRWTAAVLAALTFMGLATANAGGYRYGVSDQAFYIPALAKALDPALFPRDTAVLAPQMGAWLGDDVVAAVSRVTAVDLPTLAGVLQIATLILLAGAVAYLLRGLRASWWAVAGGLAIASLRHHIPGTGANSLEGYFHPRVLAFALGLWALAFVLRRRVVPAFLMIALAAIVHPTTAVWMGGVVVVTVLSRLSTRSTPIVIVAGVAACAWFALRGARMDAAWLSVISVKDYLFPATWAIWEWTIDLAYPVVLWLMFRRRVALGRDVPGERAVVTALLVAMLGFLLSVPLTVLHVTLAVQLQITRILWVLDGVTLLYLAWWLVDDLAAGWGMRWRGVVVALIAAVSLGRGWYVLTIDTPRPLVTTNLPADDWTAAMRFLQTQPAGIHVLADPGHAWMYGSSVRVSALRDTVLETMKDEAMAIYDRAIAMRVAERQETLEGFAMWSDDRMRDVASRYHADVFVFDRSRAFSFPVLYQNARFVVYDLR